MTIDGKDYDIDKNMVDIRIDAKEGFNVGQDNNNYVILNTTLTESLINEGIAREFVSKVQNLRKELDFNVVDRITIKYNADKSIVDAIEEFNDYIKNETLATEITLDEKLNKDLSFNDVMINITIKKNK